MSGRRVVVAGLGDTGVLTAIHLARHAEVVGISARPALVSGQELGVRVSRPHDWARDYRIAFERFRGLDRVRTVHGVLTAADLTARTVTVVRDGQARTEAYDVLVIATGVTNGFWRGRPRLQSADDIDAELQGTHARLADAPSVAVIGGGAAAVSSAFNVAVTWPDKRVDLYFPGERPLPRHHGRVWARIRRRLDDAGVGLHARHRAVVPDGVRLRRDHERAGRVRLRRTAGDRGRRDLGDRTGAPEHRVAARRRPGRARVRAGVRRPAGAGTPRRVRRRRRGGHGPACVPRPATVPTSCSPTTCAPRSRAGRCGPTGRPGAAGGRCSASRTTGSTCSPPSGHAFRFPAWSIDTVLQPWIVRRGIYRGVRRSG